MQRRTVAFIVLLLTAFILAGLSGCADKVVVPPEPPKLDPETELTFAPLPGDTTTFRIRFFWNGYDRDGEVVRFRYAIDADTVLPIKQWKSTTAKDTTFLFLVDPITMHRVHVFKIAAEDNSGRYDPTPAQRFFSAKTLPPTSEIERGPAAFNPTVGPNFTFEWSGLDPDGGETGGRAPVDSFEYQLLLVGAIADKTGDPDVDPLPPYNQDVYVNNLINAGTGPTLPPPNHDWQWQGVRGLKKRFRNATPGEYVFAIRAVDVAGATEKNLRFGRNIRHFTVSGRNTGPILTIRSSVLNGPLPPTSGPEDSPRKALQIFEGETISFSWSATADAYGGEIVGYTYALDDTSDFPGLDLQLTGATFTPSKLRPGNHFLFVRAVDDGDLVTNAVIPILIVHPIFKDPAHPDYPGKQILYVDDALSPGPSTNRIGNYPSDVEEDTWWTEEILNRMGVPYNRWDTLVAGEGDVEGRKPPEPRDLTLYSTVMWNVDHNNGVSSPTGLWKTLVGGPYSELAGYLRAGGTLVLTGFQIGGNTTDPRNTMYSNISRGICFTLEPDTDAYNKSYFPRILMGVDAMFPNGEGLRTAGARDFIAAYPTAAGVAAGYDTALIDRGDFGSGAKWITYTGSGDPNTNRQPGLPQVDGWVMARNFACAENPSAVFRLEDRNQAIALPIYTYHGVNVGVNEEGSSSPREGMVVAVRVQSHDLGNLGGSPVDITPGNAAGAFGRMVHLGFPMYYLRDPDALRLMQTAFAYVNASPTLP